MAQANTGAPFEKNEMFWGTCPTPGNVVKCFVHFTVSFESDVTTKKVVKLLKEKSVSQIKACVLRATTKKTLHIFSLFGFFCLT